jgi:twitching motility protein PilT
VTTPYASQDFVHQQLLGKALAAGASDVHLKVGQPPGARVRGDLVYFKSEKLRPEDTEAAARILLRASPSAKLDAVRDQTFAYAAPPLGRFRVTLYRQRGSLAIVLRAIPLAIPSLADLGLPAAVTSMAEAPRGLVVVAGGAGDGKTSTLAAMIGHLNASYPRHVVTVEDPIEFEHEDGRASVSQRAVGADTESLAAGAAAALRQDPDVLLISDLADAATLERALEAAEAGCLVLSSLLAPDVPRAAARLLALGRAIPDAAARLADALGGLVAQRLVPKRDGSGSVLAVEILAATAAVREALARLADGGGSPGKLGSAPPPPGGAASLRELMEKGATPYGMQTFEGHLKQLVAQGLVSRSAAAS